MENYSYLLTTSVTKSSVACGGILQTFGIFPTERIEGGLILTDSQGGGLKVLTRDNEGEEHFILQYLQGIRGAEITGAIKLCDRTLALRITTYLKEYYGTCRTNCATLAQYLKTGTFVPCDYAGEHSFVVSGEFDAYRGQRLELGDRVCLLYYKENVLDQEDLGYSYEHCHENKLSVGDDWGKIRLAEITVNAEEICAQYNLGIYADFHFLTCVGSHGDEPIFIQQMGLHDPARGGKPMFSPIVLSVGTIGVSQYEILAYAFVQKRGVL